MASPFQRMRTGRFRAGIGLGRRICSQISGAARLKPGPGQFPSIRSCAGDLSQIYEGLQVTRSRCSPSNRSRPTAPVSSIKDDTGRSVTLLRGTLYPSALNGKLRCSQRLQSMFWSACGCLKLPVCAKTSMVRRYTGKNYFVPWFCVRLSHL